MPRNVAASATRAGMRSGGQGFLAALLLVAAQPLFAKAADDQAQFNAVDGVPWELMVAVGNHGMIVHFQDGKAARQVPSSTDRNLLDVHVASRDFAVAVGQGVVLAWNGVRWAVVPVQDDTMTYTWSWASPGRDLVLYGGPADDGFKVCPWVPNVQIEPFCRAFQTPMVGACGSDDDVLLVQADGTVYRVNRTLIGTDGNFDPVYRPERPIRLREAWIPARTCDPQAGLPEIVGVEDGGRLWRFDGADWQETRYPVAMAHRSVPPSVTPATAR